MAKFKLDAIDLKILDVLQKEGHLSNQELADRIHLSQSQCSRRRSRLEQTDVIKQYTAHVSSEVLKFEIIAFFYINLVSQTTENAHKFRELATSTPEIQGAYRLTGATDIIAKVTTKNLEQLTELNDSLMANDIIGSIRISIVLENIKETTALPIYFD